MDEKRIIIYHSRSEQVMDEWLWEQGGAVYFAGFLAVVVVVLLIANSVANRRSFR